MENEIKAIIEKNLPAQVGDILKQRLDQAESDASTAKRLKEEIDRKDRKIEEQQQTIDTYKKCDERNAGLEARETSVAEGERNLKIKNLEFQLSCEKEKSQFTKDVAMGLVRNEQYRKQVFDSENQSSYYDGQGRYITPSPINKSLQETKTVD